MAFSCIGDGLSNPEEFSPFRTSGESKRDLKSTNSSVKTSPVRCLSLNLWAVRILGILKIHFSPTANFKMINKSVLNYIHQYFSLTNHILALYTCIFERRSPPFWIFSIGIWERSSTLAASLFHGWNTGIPSSLCGRGCLHNLVRDPLVNRLKYLPQRCQVGLYQWFWGVAGVFNTFLKRDSYKIAILVLLVAELKKLKRKGFVVCKECNSLTTTCHFFSV